MDPINQKEYLKKYLGIGKAPGEKKKKKKLKGVTNRVKIIDDDADTTISENIVVAELQDEDAPQIVAIIDERPPSLRVDEKTKNPLWQPIGTVDSVSVSDQMQIAGFKIASRSNDKQFVHPLDKPSKKKHVRRDDKSPPRNPIIIDDSPPRKRKEDSSPGADYSPPRKARSDDDTSPPRKSRSEDSTPPRRRNDDISPPRRRRNIDESPPRKLRSGESSPSRKSRNGGQTPPRKPKCEDMSPPRRSRNDVSPPRRNKQTKSPPRKYIDVKEERRKEENSSEKRLKKMDKTLDGKTAGLQNAQQLVEETQELRQREDQLFKNLSKEQTGENADTVFRDRKSGKVRNLEEEEERQKKKREEEQKHKEKYSRWGRGLAQVESRDQKIQEEQYEMSKPLARYADDEDLERYLKEQEREGDPMLQYIRSKKRKKAVDTGVALKPEFEGNFMPNRFGVKPGHRWDGVDRSNGYEKRWFEVQNAKTAQQEDVYKWSTEDM